MRKVIVVLAVFALVALVGSNVALGSDCSIYDFNGDGWVNATDLGYIVSWLNECDFFSVQMGDPRYDPQYDLNSDGWVNATDVGLLVSCINVNGGFFWSVQCP